MCFIFHKWGKWVDMKRGKVVDRDNKVLGSYIVQERRCEICNKVQLREATE